jgi:hypothetical protein
LELVTRNVPDIDIPRPEDEGVVSHLLRQSPLEQGRVGPEIHVGMLGVLQGNRLLRPVDAMFVEEGQSPREFFV